MSIAHPSVSPASQRQARWPAGKNTVNTQLTPKRARPVVENDQYAAFSPAASCGPMPAASLPVTSNPSPC
jgi:hypothetical protein